MITQHVTGSGECLGPDYVLGISVKELRSTPFFPKPGMPAFSDFEQGIEEVPAISV